MPHVAPHTPDIGRLYSDEAKAPALPQGTPNALEVGGIPVRLPLVDEDVSQDEDSVAHFHLQAIWDMIFLGNPAREEREVELSQWCRGS